MKRLLLLLPALLLAGAAAAEQTVVYKVKNADGTTSYSQDPVEGAEKRVVSSTGSQSRAVDEAPPPETPIPEEMAAGDEARAAAEKEACANATANLAVYDSGTSVTLAQGGGEPITLTGDELAAARAKAQDAVSRYCEPAAAATD
jgi:hypothetical protein